MSVAFTDWRVRSTATATLYWPWRFGDLTSTVHSPFISKARIIDAPGGAVLLPLEWARHGSELNGVYRKEKQLAPPPLAVRKACAIWRGAATGSDAAQAELAAVLNRKAGMKDETLSIPTRLSLVGRWSGGTHTAETGGVRLDVAFSDKGNINMFHRMPTGFETNTQYKHLFGTKIAKREMAKCRYLLAPEGNDVATGLGWQLYTDSVVLMPPPTKESWLLQGELRPWEHYVPVRSDWEDLGARLRWCEANIAAVSKISANARAHVLRVLSSSTESGRRVVVAVLHGFRRALMQQHPAGVFARSVGVPHTAAVG